MDDGTLNALLDGALRAGEPERADAVEAHLDGCADCRARMDAAAELRGRASAILGALEPDVRPDFDEVLVRAGAAGAMAANAGDSAGDEDGPSTASTSARGRSVRRQARWTRGVAWAATIVIALGTGYLIRDQLGPDPAARELERVMAPRPAADMADRAELGADVDGVTRSPPGQGATEASGAAEPESPPTGNAAGAAGPRPVEEEARSTRGADDSAPGSGDGSFATTPSPPAGRPVAQTVPTAEESHRERAEARDQAADLAERTELERLSREALVVTGVAAAPPPPSPERAAADQDGSWRTVDVAEAESVLGGPILWLPNAEPGSVEVLAAVDSAAVRSVQRLRNGLEVVVVQSRFQPPAPAEAAREADTAANRAEPVASRPVEQAYALESAAKTLLARPRAGAIAEADAATLRTVRVVRDGYELLITGAAPAELLVLLGQEAGPRRSP